MSDEQAIRTLTEQWARAVRAKDIDGVLAHHTADIVMFDVPPPVVVRGVEAYRQTWPQFFDWQRDHEGTFEITSLDVTAGGEVAFATAVLLCASKKALQEDATPQLRLTIGLRKDDGGWKIAHEHHSFPLEQTA